MTEPTTSLPTKKAPLSGTLADSLSIEKSLISDTQALAEELDMPWSQLVALALEEFVLRNQGKKSLTDKINEAYSGPLDDNEAELLRRTSTSYKKVVEGEW